MPLSTDKPKHSASQYLHALDKNPEQFGTTREHVLRVSRTVESLLANDDKARVKREQKALEVENDDAE